MVQFVQCIYIAFARWVHAALTFASMECRLICIFLVRMELYSHAISKYGKTIFPKRYDLRKIDIC